MSVKFLGAVIIILAVGCAASTAPTITVTPAPTPTATPVPIPTLTVTPAPMPTAVPVPRIKPERQLATPTSDAKELVTEPVALAEGTEQQLRRRIKESNDLFTDKQWLRMYSYTSLRYRSVCKSGDYLAYLGTGMMLMETFLGIPKDATLELATLDIQITDNEALVFGELLVDGVRLEFEDSQNEGARWVFVEGQWWQEDDNWEEGCSTDQIFAETSTPNATSIPPPTSAPTPPATSTPVPPPGHSRTQPVDIGTDLFITTASLGETTEARITLFEVVRGEEAWTRIRNENQFNSPPDVGNEYLLVRIRFEYLKGKDADATYRLSPGNFTAVASDGKEYVSKFVVVPEPKLEATMYPGASNEGWAAFQIAQYDTKPLMTFGRDYRGRGGLWWKLY